MEVGWDRPRIYTVISCFKVSTFCFGRNFLRGLTKTVLSLVTSGSTSKYESGG